MCDFGVEVGKHTQIGATGELDKNWYGTLEYNYFMVSAVRIAFWKTNRHQFRGCVVDSAPH